MIIVLQTINVFIITETSLGESPSRGLLRDYEN